MNEIISEIIPVSFYLIAIIFYIASLRDGREIILKTKTDLNNFDNNEKIRSFLNDSEKKLIALKELYHQDLIDLDLYVEKTDQIATIVSKVIGNNIFDYAKQKNNQVIDELKSGIFEKYKNESESNNKELDIDKLLLSIDNKINKKDKTDDVVYEK
tara:strand:+ start:349 stop:816 length:468 start_codon:yes stop_codon:yes gene_type:complete